MKPVLITVLIAAVVLPGGAVAQEHAGLWRNVAAKIEAGTEVNLRLRDGRSVRATFLEARENSLMVQPRTRVPVPVQEVPYEAIVVLERRTPGGMSTAKAIGIGVASGVGAFFAILGIMIAAYD